MSRLEAARTELEAVRTEVERLQAENVKLREARPEQAEAVDRAAEVERLKELYAQALRDIQAKDEQVEAVRHELDDTRQRLKRQETAAQELQSKCQALEETCDTVHAQVSRARQEGDLERLRAVESERAKWEAREARLVAQLQAAEERVGLSSLPHTQAAPSESTAEVPTPTRSLAAEVATPPRLMEPAVQGSPSSAAVQGSPSSAAAQGSPSSGESGVSAGVHATVLSQALLAHQVPPLPVFSGEGDGIGGLSVSGMSS